MRKGTYLFILVMLAIGASACGRSSERTANGGPAAASASNSEHPTTPADPAPANDGISAGSIAVAANRRLDVADHPASATPPPLQFQAAGEDSEIAVTMRPDGSVYEVRVFKTHPQFSKIEAVWNGINEKTLTFNLRNGRVIEKRTDRLQNLQTASTSLLLEIAGLATADPTARQVDRKKRG